MRREFIYPHRSVRGLQVSRKRLIWSAIFAVLLFLLIWLSMQMLLDAHSGITSLLLKAAAIPASEGVRTQVFDVLGSATLYGTPVHGYVRATGALLVFVAFFAPLLVLFVFVPLARGYVIFLTILLVVGLCGVLVPWVYRFDSVSFQLTWLRTETCVWLLMPFASSFLILLFHPSPGRGVMWVLGIQAWAFLWSPFRLVFCLGILHYAGAIAAPALWFNVALIADLLYVLLAYSMMLHRVGGAFWGSRSSWQS